MKTRNETLELIAQKLWFLGGHDDIKSDHDHVKSEFTPNEIGAADIILTALEQEELMHPDFEIES